MKDPKADASLYLLTGLFQRLESERPGLIQEMIDGVQGDRAALPSGIEDSEHVQAIFDEALGFLKRANNA